MNGQIIKQYNGISVTVIGGPYRDRVTGVPSVKLAPEVKGDADLVLHIEDFSTPPDDSLRVAVSRAVDMAEDAGVIYVGCMGGYGRTGLFIACMMLEMAARALKPVGFFGLVKDKLAQLFIPGHVSLSDSRADAYMVLNGPIEYTRHKYHPHAVETEAQERQVCRYREYVLSRLTNNI